ncbi:MAG: DUF6095 family protein [Flavobacteriaceae bacterium]|nr:DUF6095 family protein [Flavobacteriaceae bacterium]
MKTKKSKLNKSITFLGITFPLLFIAPLLLNLGFKAIGRIQITLGYVLTILGAIIGIVAVVLMAMGIKYLLDHLFEK